MAVVAGVSLQVSRSPGVAVTGRDVEILEWVGRHGVVTPEQVAEHFFGRDDGSVGYSAAYRRLRKIESLGLLRRNQTFYREAHVLRLTGAGAGLVGDGVHPARLVLAEVHHSIAVVTLTERLLAENPGVTLTTERQIRAENYRERLAGQRPRGRGRTPDAVLHFPRKTVAVELDLTPKRSKDFERILVAYKQERFDEVWWYVLPRVVERVSNLVRQNRAADFVSIRAWEG